MARIRGCCLRFCFLICAIQTRPGFAEAIDLGTIHARDRISEAPEDGAMVARLGDVHPLARKEFDTGRAKPEVRLDRLILVLQPDSDQQKALDTFLTEVQDPESANYRRWLTPEEFGEHFGVSGNDIRPVTAWLERHGLEIDELPAGGRAIVFSGSVAQVEAAFQTELHVYRVHGETHLANASAPRIPQAFAQVVTGVASLHDFRKQAQHRRASLETSGAPEFTGWGSYYLGPADFATIYDLAPLYNSSVNGSGQTIAVVGRTDINLSDVKGFRSEFGLPPNIPSVIVNGANPGIVSADEQGEATLDVEWAGAVGQQALVELVVSASTNTTDGVDLSAQYIVSHNLAAVMTTSFGACEAFMGQTENQFWSALWQQAAAQGISAVVASGDSGAAGCNAPSAAQAAYGPGVNGLCSSPNSTCVGGTEFEDSTRSVYWSQTNTPNTLGSALSYIPEAVWNQSGSGGLWAGGGGASSIYAKPAWQAGTGVPVDGKRDVPDVALSAAGHDGYIVVLNGANYIFSGTSAATPSFAALAALTAEMQNGRLGNLNPTLYALAARQATGGAAVFHDVTTGNNSVPGVTGYSAGSGYDLASGLGSVDAAVLANHWPDVAGASVAGFSLTAAGSPVSVAPGSSGAATISLSVSGGFNSSVSLIAGPLPAGVTATFSPAVLTAAALSSRLTLSTSAQARPGAYSLSISGSNGGINHAVDVALTVTSACTYTLAAAQGSAPAAGGTYSDTLMAGPGCVWGAVSNNAWIRINGGGSGTGNGTISYTVGANYTTSSRTGTMVIGGRVLTITQAAAVIGYTLSPASASYPDAGGSGSFTVRPAGSAAWAATSGVSWITLTAGKALAPGARSISYSVAANPSAAPRTGTVNLPGGYAFDVSQAGVFVTIAVTVGPLTPARSGMNDTVSVVTSPNSSWTASSNVPWIVLLNRPPAKGSGSVTVSILPDPGNTPRSGVLSIAGKSIAITEKSPTEYLVGPPL